MNNPYKKFLMNFAQATFVVIVGFIVTAITFKLMAEVSPIEDGLLTTVNLFFDIGVYMICIIYSWRNLNIDIERKEKSFFSYQNEGEEEDDEEEKKEDEVYTSIPVFPVFAPSPIKHVVGNNKNKTFNVFPTHVCRQEEILRQIEEQNMTAQMMEQMSPPVEEDITSPPDDTEIW